MKNIAKFLLALACVCLLIACSKSDDDPALVREQVKLKSKPVDTRTYTGYLLVEWDITIPVYCDGVLFDTMVRPYNETEPFLLPTVDHYNNGAAVWYSDHFSNINFTSKNTGEIFTIKGNLERWIIDNKYYWKFNFVGKKGKHYMCHLIYDAVTWELIEAKSNCH